MIISMSNIVCITNRHLCKEDFLTRIIHIASYHPKAIILREKDMTPEDYLELASQVISICKKYNVKCILHSFSSVATSLKMNTIHLPLPLLRSMSKKERSSFLVLGASCHSVEEAKEAEALGCSYIIVGHIFETDCKKGLPGRGLEFLQNVISSVNIPVYAIGGINETNISQVLHTGADGACLMSSLMSNDNISQLMKK